MLYLINFYHQVRWGDKKGGYGEHYWDLNHAGHTDDHHNGYDDGSDDGSYREDSNDPYDEPSHQSPTYGTEEYDPEQASYEENGRAKRAHSRHSIKTKKTEKFYEEGQKQEQKNDNENPETNTNDESDRETIVKKNVKPRRSNIQSEYKEDEKQKEKNDFVLIVDHKDKEDTKEPKDTVARQIENQFVPYEDGAGVRQHYYPQIVASASVPRLFLEPSTGHVVDRATGRAYVLQPIVHNPIYN